MLQRNGWLLLIKKKARVKFIEELEKIIWRKLIKPKIFKGHQRYGEVSLVKFLKLQITNQFIKIIA